MKLVLVDDEPIVLAGLQSILAEHVSEFTIAALCGSGEEALAAIARELPDIVITDIRMGGMSGLDLIERIRALDEQVVVILLTGYSDFAFARKALSLGVFEYLVKPTRHEDILSCLRRAADKRDRMLSASFVPMPPFDDTDDHMQDLLQSVLSETASPESVRTAQQALMRETRAYYVLDVRIEPKPDANAVCDSFSLSQSLRGLFRSAFSGTARLVFIPRGVDGLIAVAFTRQADQATTEQVARTAGACARDALSILGAHIVIGLSSDRSVLSDLPTACAEAASARSHALKGGHSFASHANRQSAVYSPPIKKALSYIQAHFTESISLKDISAEVFLNSWYFSELFKKEVGKPFTDYILELRIERARQLIADRRLPLYQISYMVGMNSPTYFSQVFKKATGFTPKEYRARLTQR